MKRVDPDALVRVLHMLDHKGMITGAIDTVVVDDPAPAPVPDEIPEAVYLAWWESWCQSAGGIQPFAQMSSVAQAAITAAVLTDRELRSKACGSSSSPSPSPSPSPSSAGQSPGDATTERSQACGGSSERSSCSESSAEPSEHSSASHGSSPNRSGDGDATTDPRRLTDTELSEALSRCEDDRTYRAVADAQLAKAGQPVRISGGELSNIMDRDGWLSVLKKLMESGVEVTDE